MQCESSMPKVKPEGSDSPSFFAKTRSVVTESRLSKKTIHFSSDFDRWYPQLKNHTFKSKILPIDVETAKAMVNFYKRLNLGKGNLTSNDIEAIKSLEQQIDALIQLHFEDEGVFVRMSNRSPKDGTPLLESSDSMYLKLKEISMMEIDDNSKVIKISDEQMKVLRCTKSRQVLNLLLTSERVFSDLLLAIDCFELNETDKWSTSIILREWQPLLKQENEFRLFVKNGKVTAISQYTHYCCYPKLSEDNSDYLDLINKKLSQFAQSIHDEVGQDDYILDLALIGEEVKIIELNPFHKSTGGCMFSWHGDKALLYGTKESDTAKLRVRKEPLKEINTMVEMLLEEHNQSLDKSNRQVPYFELYPHENKKIGSCRII
jgi:D123